MHSILLSQYWVIWSLKICPYRPQEAWHPAMPQAVPLTQLPRAKEMLRVENDEQRLGGKQQWKKWARSIGGEEQMKFSRNPQKT